MNATQNTELELRLNRLGQLIQLQFDARHADTLDELFFLMANNTRRVTPYRQAAIWSVEKGKRGRIVAASGTPDFDPNAPYIAWLSKVLRHVSQVEPSGAKPVTPDDLPPALRMQWSDWLPAQALWAPIVEPNGAVLGGIFLSGEDIGSEDDSRLLAQLIDAYGAAWASFIARRSLFRVVAGGIFSRKLTWIAVLLFVSAMFTPLSQSVLAPGEVTAKSLVLARSHLKGVVNRVHVKPNEVVRQGQLLVDLESTDLRNRLRVAELDLEVTRAEFRQGAQKAVFDAKSKARLQLLQGVLKVQAAKVKRVRDQLDRTEVRASRAGVAIFSDVNDWIGRPVITGEKIMKIADPSSVILEIDLPVSDAIALETGAKVVFFLNVDPENVLEARVESSSFRATVTPDGVLAYRVKANLDRDVTPPRIGLRGTAKLYGEKTNLFFFLFRRPLAKTRQWLGL